LEEGRVVPFCPEVAGGLPVPRPAAEIQGEGGEAVLDLDARVLTRTGDDVTVEFLEGARRALKAVRDQGVGLAVLVDGSPSCGSLEIHDGSFAGNRRPGQGVTAALLERHGIRVFAEDRLDEAARHLAVLESRGRIP
jgi:uncharacterized protein YbbK (DUF523 family)